MLLGIFCGLSAALLNSFGYLVSARLMKKSDFSGSLLLYTHLWLLVLSLPVACFIFPKGGIAAGELSQYIRALIFWIIVFAAGQGSFFMAQKYMESSKISALLGLKIIVLTLIMLLTRHISPNAFQWTAVALAAGAGILMNWDKKFNLGGKGMIFVAVTLIGYSLSDINESSMVLCFVNSGIPTLKSAVIATTAAYTVLGALSLPGLFFIKFDGRRFCRTFGYAFPWLLSQIMLLACFAALLPVFANVLLAMRGVFSVVLGIFLSALGLHDWDAHISKKQWALRGIAAFIMILAVALYSWGAMK